MGWIKLENKKVIMTKSEPNDYSTEPMEISKQKHGGNVYVYAKKKGLIKVIFRWRQCGLGI